MVPHFVMAAWHWPRSSHRPERPIVELEEYRFRRKGMAFLRFRVSKIMEGPKPEK